ncbi:MAG: hypothetical protein KI792_06440 [Alphaproteobacteria bacterium]|nr:hypothetical protein [Alphaproteobacteria bacterium SS10]
MTETINTPMRDEALAATHPRARGGVSYLPQSAPAVIEVKRPLLPRLFGWLSLLVSIGWVGGLGYLLVQQGLDLQTTPVLEIISQFSVGIAPLAVLWLIALFIQRNADQRTVAEALRKTSAQITMPVDKAEARLQAITEATDRQVKMLADATNLAISRIDQARQSLRHETEALTAVSARSAGEVDRVGSFLREQSAGIDEAIGLLRDQANNTEEQTAAILNSLEGRTGDLKVQVSGMVDELGTAADTFQEKLEQARESTAGQFSKVEETTQTITDRLTDAEAALGRRVDDYKILAENASTLAESLAVPLGRNADLLRTAAIQSAKGMRAANEMMRRQLTAFEAAHGNASSVVDGLAAKIEDQVARVQKAMADAKVNGDQVNEQSSQTIEALREATVALTEKFIAMRGEIGETATTLAKAAGATQQLTGDLNTATDALKDANSDTESQTATLRGIEEELNARLGDLRSLDATLVAQAERVRAAGENAKGTSDLVVDQLSESIAKLQEAGEQTKVEAESFVATLDGQEERVDQLSKHLLGSSQAMNDNLGEEVNKLTALTNGALEQLTSMRDSLSREALALGEAANDAVSQVNQASAGLDNQAEQINQVGETVAENLGVASKRVADELEVLRSGAAETEARVNRIGTKISEQIGELKSGMQRVQSDMDDIITNFSKRGGDLGELSRMTLDNLNAVSSRLTETVTEADALVGKSLNRIGDIEGDLSGKLAELQESSDLAGERLASIAATFDREMANITGKPDEVLEKVQALSDQLGEKLDDVDALVDRTGQRVDNLSKGLQGRLNFLNDTLGDALGEFGSVEERLRTYLDQLSEGAEGNTERLRGLGQALVEEVSQINDMADETVNKLNGALGELRSDLDGVLNQTNDQVSQLDSVRMSLSNQSNQFVTSTETVFIRIGQIENKMMEQRANFAAAYDATLNRLEDSTISLGIRLQELGDRTDRVVKSLEGASSSVSRHSEKLMEAADSASTKSSDVSDTFRRHAEALAEAAEKAMEQAKLIKDTDSEAQRDAFLAAAKFVIESLHSISVDFVRMLDDEAPEALWKSFASGDTSVFTRRLVSSKDKIAVGKIKMLFEENSEFRLYVQRYIRQFEEVFGRAISTDHGDLLSSTFMTSDIGKLYLALCQGIERQPLSDEDIEKMPAQGQA